MGATPPNSGPIAKMLAHGVAHNGVAQVLRAVRKHLGMDVAFIAHFRETDRVLEHVDSDGMVPIHEGQAIPLEDGYCLKVVRGELPQLIPDTSALPAAMALPETRGIPIGSHVSVPIELANGDVYGTLCCFSRIANPTLGERDMRMMRTLGEVLAARIDEDLAAGRSKLRVAEEIRLALSSGALRIVYQPIYEFVGPAVAMSGVECLSRFDFEPRRTPDVWFNAAYEAGVGTELELRAIELSVRALEHLPVPLTLSLNSSPELLISGQLEDVLRPLDLSRVVLEITEHAAVADYDALVDSLAPLRARGARLAIDDAGAGYASMRHILNLKADVIKLDISITRQIDSDASRRALAKSLIAFAHEIGSTITAEGVETKTELAALRMIGVDKVQGYFLSRPQALQEVVAAAESESGTFRRADVEGAPLTERAVG